MGLSLGDQALSLSGEHMLTDCTHCGATFRVTPAQLGASGGRVRCGLCSQVFDGFVRLRSEPEPGAAPSVAPAPPDGEPADASVAPNDALAVPLVAPHADALPEPVPAESATTPDTSIGDNANVAPSREVTDFAPEGSPPSRHEAPVTENTGTPETGPPPFDDDVELAFDAADTAELDGTLTDIEIPTDLPAVETDGGVGADALEAIRSAAEPLPAPGSEERAILDDTLTDIEIPTELLELTVVDDDELPGASHAEPAPVGANTAVGDVDATWIGDPEPPEAAVPSGEAASRPDASQAGASAFSPAAEPDRQSPEAGTDPLPLPAGTRDASSADAEIIPGFPGFVPEGMPAARDGNAPSPLATPPVPPKRRAGRALMGTATVILALLLPVQGMLLFRDALADRYPAMHPILDGVCRQAGCRVALPRRSDRLEIETSDLQALDPARPNRVVLIATIRNLAPLTQDYPQLELTLTDPADRPLARRVFDPTHYLPESVAPDGGFAPRGEVSVRLQLDTGSVAPSGYRLFLFHR